MQVGSDRRIRMETVNTGALDRTLAAFDEDRAAIRACPERKAARPADELRELMKDEAEEALQAVCSATPATLAGLLAMLDLFMTREAEILSAPHDITLASLFAPSAPSSRRRSEPCPTTSTSKPKSTGRS